MTSVRWWWFAALTLCVSLVGCAQRAARAAPQPELAPAEVEQVPTAAGIRYHEVLRGGAQPGDRVPMVVMVHGLGDRAVPSRVGRMPEPVRVIVPQAPTPYGKGFAWWTTRTREDKPIEQAAGIERAAARMADALQVLTRRYPTAGKPIVTGFSQGGMLSYALGLHHPQLVSTVHPMSGMLPAPLWPQRPRAGVAYPNIVASHGTADEIVPMAPDRALARHLAASGFDIEWHEIDQGRHRVTAEQGALMRQTLHSAIRRQAEL